MAPGMEEIANQVIDTIDLRISRMSERADSDERAILLNMYDMMTRYALAVIHRILYKSDDLINFLAERDAVVDKVQRGVTNFTNPLTQLSFALPFLKPILAMILRYSLFYDLAEELTKQLKGAV